MKFIKSFVLKCHFIWMGIKNIFKLNLLDRVIYQGRVYSLYQGLYHPKWHLRDIETHECFQYIHKDNFRKQISFSNIIWDIKSTYKFYMDYWYDIFMRVIPPSKCFIVNNRNWTKYKND